MKRKNVSRQIALLCILALFCGLFGGQFTFQTALAETANEGTYVNPKDITASVPVMNAAQNEVKFNLENLTSEDKKLTIYVKSFDNSKISGVNEYAINLKSGTEKMPVTLAAKPGDVISIYDEKGNYYVKSIEVGKKQDSGSKNWVATWASAQQSLDPKRSEYPQAPGLKNNTFRQIIRISNGGSQFRFSISNEYGNTPLVLNSVHIAKPTGIGDSAIDTATDTQLTFGGSESVSIPAGKIMTSDAVDYNAKDCERIAISICFGDVPTMVTSHTGGRTTAFLVTGNHVSDASIKAGSKTNEQWYFISSIDVAANANARSIACLGDSITDGRGVTTNMDNRWTDILADRLQANASTADVSVLNQGIGGNSIFGGLGPAAHLRYKRDVLDQLGVKYAIVFEGVNDIGYSMNANTADQIIEKYKSFVEQGHAKGIKVYGATITPFKGNGYYTPLREQMRQKLNDFIRNGKCFDGCIDFDAAIRDKADPEKMDSKYYNGINASDWLHPNAAGYKALGECIDLTLFEK